MINALRFAPLAALALAACASQPEPEVEVAPEVEVTAPSINSVTIDGVTFETLADQLTAAQIAARAKSSAARGYEGDNKGNACYSDPVFTGVSGGDVFGTRREEFWNYTVCGENYEVPVVVTADEGAVDFVVGSGREAR